MCLLGANWELFAYIATVFGFPLAASVAAFSVMQSRATKKASYLQAWRELDDLLTSEKQRSLRKHIINTDPFPDPIDATDEFWDKVEQVANAFDRVGFYMDHGLIESEMVFDRYASIIVRSWEILCVFVDYNREVRANSKRSWRYFESANRKAQKYLKRNFPDHLVDIYMSLSFPKDYDDKEKAKFVLPS